jgi:alkylated DNA nucleotide flippase Atl1
VTETAPTVVYRNGKSTLIPDEAMLSAAVRDLPAGRVTELGGVRRSLAEAHGTEMCCPVTVQRLLVEFSRHGDVPYWRVVDADRPFAKRLEGGADRVREMQAAERA